MGEASHGTYGLEQGYNQRTKVEGKGFNGPKNLHEAERAQGYTHQLVNEIAIEYQYSQWTQQKDHDYMYIYIYIFIYTRIYKLHSYIILFQSETSFSMLHHEANKQVF